MSKQIEIWGKTYDKPKKQNPMVRVCGAGPEGERCKNCKHITKKKFGNTYYKCALRINTNGPATDHRINWPVCAKFEKSE